MRRYLFGFLFVVFLVAVWWLSPPDVPAAAPTSHESWELRAAQQNWQPLYR